MFILLSYDYLDIKNEINNTVGTYCGNRTGQNVFLNGSQIFITFHSNSSVPRRGFLIHFAAVPYGKNKHTFLVRKMVCLQSAARCCTLWDTGLPLVTEKAIQAISDLKLFSI